MEYYSAMKSQIMPFAWVDLEIIILSEKSQTKKDKLMNLFIKQK